MSTVALVMELELKEVSRSVALSAMAVVK